jgi:hypothetical protein
MNHEMLMGDAVVLFNAIVARPSSWTVTDVTRIPVGPLTTLATMPAPSTASGASMSTVGSPDATIAVPPRRTERREDLRLCAGGSSASTGSATHGMAGAGSWMTSGIGSAYTLIATGRSGSTCMAIVGCSSGSGRRCPPLPTSNF